MSRNFCTLFDKNYVFQGLALYHSLERHGHDFNLWILCLDEATYSLLAKLDLKKATLVRLGEIENEALLAAKATRSWGEYCWTLASAFTYYLITKYPELAEMTYLDSDLYFYSSPEPIFQEMGNNSVLIVRHNYSPALKYLEKKAGIYNVSLVAFKNDRNGLSCLNYWREQCLDWCYNRHEDGKFGDQKYLDAWPKEFPGVQVISHPGANVAPWNIDQYRIDEQMLINGRPLIFYHFHTLKVTGPSHFQLHSSFYRLSSKAHQYIYQPYIDEIKSLINLISKTAPEFPIHYQRPENVREKLRQKAKRLLVNLYFSRQKYEDA